MSSGSTVACVTIAGVALMQLTNRLDTLSSGFFEWETNEQIAVFGLLFAVVFTAVSVSQDLNKASSASSSSKAFKTGVSVQHKPPQTHSYPLEELAKCTDDKARFLCLYPMLRDEMLQHMKKHNEMPQEAIDWTQKMMDYTVPGGKLNRGTTVVTVYRALLQRELTGTELARAAVLGWTIEFLQAFFLVADDCMDDSQTRRGQPCWYKLPHVKLIAINDSFLLESFVFGILRQHFGHEPALYAELLDCLLDVTQKTEFGQLLDLTSQPADGKIDLNRFTLQRYKSIVKYKTAFYSFYLPVALGMILAGITDVTCYDTARRILMTMGEYFQVQDDYLDCFGDPAIIGKVGTDIQDNKCSWLVVQALHRCNDTQRKTLEQNYGVWNDKKVATVKKLYQDLGLKQVFAEYEEESYRLIQDELDQITLMPRDVFEILLNKIYKRSK